MFFRRSVYFCFIFIKNIYKSRVTINKSVLMYTLIKLYATALLVTIFSSLLAAIIINTNLGSRARFAACHCNLMCCLPCHLCPHHYCLPHHPHDHRGPGLGGRRRNLCQPPLRQHGVDYSNFCGLFNFWSCEWNLVDLV